jgi:hypothetical protein
VWLEWSEGRSLQVRWKKHWVGSTTALGAICPEDCDGKPFEGFNKGHTWSVYTIFKRVILSAGLKID